MARFIKIFDDKAVLEQVNVVKDSSVSPSEWTEGRGRLVWV